ncbi:MAG: hypothetical protein Q8N05_13920 [Bacteroidota bacterium]|nr:hypothetical protein [Bacteroidota bacterium]
MKRKISQIIFWGILVLFTSKTFAQSKVNGTVKSSSGEFLPGVIIAGGSGMSVVSWKLIIFN